MNREREMEAYRYPGWFMCFVLVTVLVAAVIFWQVERKHERDYLETLDEHTREMLVSGWIGRSR